MGSRIWNIASPIATPPGKAEDPSVSCPPEHPFALQ